MTKLNDWNAFDADGTQSTAAGSPARVVSDQGQPQRSTAAYVMTLSKIDPVEQAEWMRCCAPSGC
ncbi:MAG: hypothetical protein ACREDW_10095 [Aestuariivirgaceae bacterium]